MYYRYGKTNPYPRTIDVVTAVRRSGKFPKEKIAEMAKKSGLSVYQQTANYIRDTYRCKPNQAMQAARYFI